MSFHVIAGSGHCGTMWLARVLNSVPGQSWHHERRTNLTNLQWWEADYLSPHMPIFDPYWCAIQGDMQFHAVVGDSNSWPPESLPEVNRIMPIERVIYLTRDKGKQLHSLLHHSPVWGAPEWPAVAWHRLALYAEITGEPHRRDPALLVEANDFMPGWLRSKGLNVDEYSLEELTTDYHVFRDLTGMTEGEFDVWRKRDINRKVTA